MSNVSACEEKGLPAESIPKMRTGMFFETRGVFRVLMGFLNMPILIRKAHFAARQLPSFSARPAGGQFRVAMGQTANSSRSTSILLELQPGNDCNHCAPGEVSRARLR